MSRTPTFILKIVVELIVIFVAGVCLFILPRLLESELADAGDFDYGVIFIGMYITAVPFFIALHKTLKLLGYIDKNKAFSPESADAIAHIKYCAIFISAFYAFGMPYIYYLGQQDDAPGVVVGGIIIVFASFVIATFAGVLQVLVQHAVDIKTENDLTV